MFSTCQQFIGQSSCFFAVAQRWPGGKFWPQWLSHWLCDTTTVANGAKGCTAPEGLWVHSTRGMAASAALFRSVSVSDICSAALRSSPSPLIKYYLRDIATGSSCEAVLGNAAGKRLSRWLVDI